MAMTKVFFSDLKSGRCSSIVEARLLRFWEAKNLKRGGELMWMDLLMRETGCYLALFIGRGVLLCRKIVQLLALLLELDHFAPLKADVGLTMVRQHGGVHDIVLYFHSYSNPFFFFIPKICSINMFQFMSFVSVF
ncbi:hypothetical protein Bca4012_042918 [Brassica carinata]